MSTGIDIFKSVLSHSPDMFSLVQSAISGDAQARRRIEDILNEVSESQRALERLQSTEQGK